MKIEVKENSNEKDSKQCEYPLDYEYSGEEKSDNDLKIFISGKTLNEVDGYLSGDLNNELGGVLLGEVCINREKKNFILIDSLIIAKHSNSSLSRLTFTHETWDYINEVRERDFPEKKILGWFHSHPGHTVFLSSFDLFIQENFFNMDYMVAYVFDPTIKERGFFQWRDGKIVKSEGYYVFENNDKDEYDVMLPNNNNDDLLKIVNKENAMKDKKDDRYRNLKTISFLLLTLCILLLMIYNIYDINQKSLLEEEYLKDLNEVKMENKKLTERLNKLIMEIELNRKDTVENSELLKNSISNNSKINAGGTDIKEEGTVTKKKNKKNKMNGE